MKKITLFIMTFKGLKTLEALVEANLHSSIEFVVIGKDNNTLNDYSEEIQSLCKKEGIAHFSKSDELPKIPGYIITISWRWLIKNVSSKNIIVFHESLLPKYRGFAPLVNQLICGEKEIGVTAIFGEKEYDTGEIIGQEVISINYPISIQKAIEKVSDLYGKLIVFIISDIIKNGHITTNVSQIEDNATYSLWRDEDDYAIDWTKSSAFIRRFVDSVGFPYKGASSLLNGNKIRIKKVCEMEDKQIEIRDVGKVIFLTENKPVIVCGKGLIRIDEAVYDQTGSDIFPLSKFRNRFA